MEPSKEQLEYLDERHKAGHLVHNDKSDIGLLLKFNISQTKAREIIDYWLDLVNGPDRPI